jgi:glycosyltransferase involved in cell wall biosynthesis
MKLNVAEGVPFEQYQQMMDGSDAILDQLYSYTPSMNPLLAMSKGIICIGGGEPENYEILGETQLRPIINVQPNYESVYHELEQLILHPERIPLLKTQSREYVSQHHDYLKVARQYEQLYQKLLTA